MYDSVTDEKLNKLREVQSQAEAAADLIFLDDNADLSNFWHMLLRSHFADIKKVNDNVVVFCRSY